MNRLGDRLRLPEMGLRPLVIALCVFGAIERIALASVYGPVESGDTGSYLRLARALTDSLLSGYDGTRVPGYPAFLALVDGNLYLAWLVQLAMGWAISLMMFWLGWSLTRNPWIGFAAGMMYNLLPGPFLFEFNLLSETLATFFLTAAFSLFSLTLQLKRLVGLVFVCLAVGIVAGLAALTRTLFFTLPIWFLLFLLGDRTRSWPEKALAGCAIALPSALMLGGWVGFIFQTYGMLAPTTMGGYHMVQHTGEFFEYVPDDHAVIRDVFLQYRDDQIRERGSAANAIWDAIPALTEASGLNFFDLSRRLQSISIDLIAAYPLLYLRNVVEGWIWFWKAPVYWVAGAAHGVPVIPFRLWTLLGRGLTLLSNASFLLLSGLAVFSGTIREGLRGSPMIPLIGGYVWLSSIVQTLADHGDNPRFLIPLQSLVLLIIIWAVQEWRSQKAIQPLL